MVRAAVLATLESLVGRSQIGPTIEPNGIQRQSFVPLMSPGIDLKRGNVIAHRRNLFKVNRKEGADGPGRLVLMDVAQLMRNQPIANVAMADKDGMSERDAAYVRSEQSGLAANGKEFWMVGLR
jgi:hypothetical protein